MSPFTRSGGIGAANVVRELGSILVERGAHVADPEDRDTCHYIPFSSKARSFANQTISTQCRYSDKCTKPKASLAVSAGRRGFPSAVPRSGRSMCAKMIEPGVLLNIAVAT